MSATCVRCLALLALLGCAGTPPASVEEREEAAASDDDPLGARDPGADGDPAQLETDPAISPEASERHEAPWTRELRVASAPFDEPRAPSVIVHAPPAFDADRPLRLVVFLHGWSGCVRMLMLEGAVPCRDGERARDGWGLATRFDEAGSDALFVMPQLAFMQRDGSAGAFVEAGRFRAFLDEVLAALGLPGASTEGVESITILAHSAGFESALAVISRGGVEVRDVVLLDALYRGVSPFAEWLAGGSERRLVSLYTGTARTAGQSQMLAARARGLIGAAHVALDPEVPLVDAIRAHRVVVARSPAAHASVPARHLPELLGALGLSARP